MKSSGRLAIAAAVALGALALVAAPLRPATAQRPYEGTTIRARLPTREEEVGDD